MKKLFRPWPGRWFPADLAILRRQNSEVEGVRELELVSGEP